MVRRLYYLCWFGLVSVGCGGARTNQVIKDLEGLEIGNGIALHPFENWALISRPSDLVNPGNGKPFYKIYSIEYRDGIWDATQPVAFESEFNDYHPVFSPDGRWVYFNSDRPIPGDSLPAEKMNIWRVAVLPEGFSDPAYLDDINTRHHESYPSAASDGSLYFNSDRPGGRGSMDIYKAKSDGIGFLQPEPVEALNTADSENDLTIDAKGRFIVFNRYLFDTKEVDLFIAYSNGASWTAPQALAKLNKPGVWELTPTLTPDGEFLLLEVDGKIQVLLKGNSF